MRGVPGCLALWPFLCYLIPYCQHASSCPLPGYLHVVSVVELSKHGLTLLNPQANISISSFNYWVSDTVSWSQRSSTVSITPRVNLVWDILLKSLRLFSVRFFHTVFSGNRSCVESVRKKFILI